MNLKKNVPESITLYAGSTENYTITVSNSANGPVPATVSCSLNADPDNDGVEAIVDVGISPEPPQNIPALGSVNFTVTVTAASDSPTEPFEIAWAVERAW